MIAGMHSLMDEETRKPLNKVLRENLEIIEDVFDNFTDNGNLKAYRLLNYHDVETDDFEYDTSEYF